MSGGLILSLSACKQCEQVFTDTQFKQWEDTVNRRVLLSAVVSPHLNKKCMQKLISEQVFNIAWQKSMIKPVTPTSLFHGSSHTPAPVKMHTTIAQAFCVLL